MSKDTIFLYIVAIVAVCFAITNGLQFLLKRGRTAQTVGTIYSIVMPNAETAKARNSKWAEVAYVVNGKLYHSQNRIQVPMTSQVGGSVTIRYDINCPEKLYSYSALRIVVSLLIAAVCVIAAVFKLV